MEEISSHAKPPVVLADGQFHHVDPKAVSVSRVSMAITSLVLITVTFWVLPFVTFGPGVAPNVRLFAWLAWAALFPVLGISSWAWPAVRYRHTWFSLQKDCFVVRKGVFWKTETVVPKSRIQHIDVAQGPLQRAYEVSDLIIHTAGTRFALVPLGGLSQWLAPKLRNHLLDRRDDDNTL